MSMFMTKRRQTWHYIYNIRIKVTASGERDSELQQNEGNKKKKQSRDGIRSVLWCADLTGSCPPNPPPDDSSRTRNRGREMNVPLSGEKSERGEFTNNTGGRERETKRASILTSHHVTSDYGTVMLLDGEWHGLVSLTSHRAKMWEARNALIRFP